MHPQEFCSVFPSRLFGPLACAASACPGCLSLAALPLWLDNFTCFLCIRWRCQLLKLFQLDRIEVDRRHWHSSVASLAICSFFDTIDFAVSVVPVSYHFRAHEPLKKAGNRWNVLALLKQQARGDAQNPVQAGGRFGAHGGCLKLVAMIGWRL